MKLEILGLRRRYRHFTRIAQIAGVFVRHRLGHWVERLGLRKFVPLRKKWKRGRQAEKALTVPQRVALAFEELGPAFVKIGQLLSTRPDIIPPEYVKELQKLQDRVAPFDSALAFERIEEELGQPLNELFREIEPEPFAAGSVAQVYKAVTQAGDTVIVKIKRPGIDRQIDTDIQIVRYFAQLAERRLPDLKLFRPTMIIDEFDRIIRRELNFLTEASNTERFYREFKDSSVLRTPRLFWQYTTDCVLTAEWLEGRNIAEVAADTQDGEKKRALAKTLMELFIRQYFEKGFFHADPHPGNVMVAEDGSLNLVDFGVMGRLSTELKGQLATTMSAAVNREVDLIVDVYADIGVFTPETDLKGLRIDLEDLIDHYYGLPLKRMDVRSILREILDLARKYYIILPRDFVLLAKSFGTLSGLVLMLDKDFDVFAAARPYAKRFLFNWVSPKSVKHSAARAMWYTHSFVKNVPLQAKELSRKLVRGQLGFTFKHEGIEQFIQELDRSSNRLAFSITLASIVVGSSLIILSDKGPKIEMMGGISLFGLAGFAVAGILGIWLLIAIFRSGKL